MDAQSFDRFAKRLARGLSRRRLIGGMAAITVASALPRPAAARPRWPDECIPGCICVSPYGCPCCSTIFDGPWSDPFDAPTMAFAGIAGAGTIRTEQGDAQFTLFASRLSEIVDLPADAAVPFGRVQWRDPEMDLTLESSLITAYGWQTDVEGGRWVLGAMRANGAEDEYPFILKAVAADPAGSGSDRVSLRVGDATIDDKLLADGGWQPTGFGYTAEGELVAGDLQLLDIDMSQQVLQQTTQF